MFGKSCCPNGWRVSAELLADLTFIPSLLSNSCSPHQRHRQLFAEFSCGWRSFQGSVEPCPQVSEDEQLLAQQSGQIGKRRKRGFLAVFYLGAKCEVE